MLLVLEILFFITGAWALITGNIPSRLFKVLFGKGNYQAESGRVRMIGLLLAAPLPIALVVGFVAGALFGGEAICVASLLEFVSIIAVALVARNIARKMIVEPSEVDFE